MREISDFLIIDYPENLNLKTVEYLKRRQFHFPSTDYIMKEWKRAIYRKEFREALESLGIPGNRVCFEY